MNFYMKIFLLNHIINKTDIYYLLTDTTIFNEVSIYLTMLLALFNQPKYHSCYMLLMCWYFKLTLISALFRYNEDSNDRFITTHTYDAPILNY